MHESFQADFVMKRGYQHSFSAQHGASMYDVTARERKAKTMCMIVRDYYKDKDISAMSLLDVGASTGIIDHFLATRFAHVTGIDIDHDAIRHAQSEYSCPNLVFKEGDAMSLEFEDNSFDVVICSQVYEHVPDAARMMEEIKRVLKPGGICYFAATNRLSIDEHHYNLPFLSVIPRPLGHVYLRLAGKGEYYYEKHLSYWSLKKLVRPLEIIDYTRKTIFHPELFGVDYMLQPGSRKQTMARIIVDWFYWLCPGYIWLLRKPE